MPSSFMSGQCSGYQASPSHAGSTSAPTPSSWFAVRYVHGFCLMLPPDTPFLVVPLPCWRRPSVRKRRTIMFPTSSETAACASCQAHVSMLRQGLSMTKGMLKKAASGVLALLPCSRTNCTLRASKRLRPCWTNFFEHSLQLMRSAIGRPPRDRGLNYLTVPQRKP